MSENTSNKLLVPPRHEATDVSLRFMLGLFALIGVTLLAMVWLAYALFPGEVRDQRFAQPFPTYPSPRLQTDPAADMQQFLAAELQELNSAGWKDRGANVVHIPIDQAMRLVAKDGIPDWPTAPPQPGREDERR